MIPTKFASNYYALTPLEREEIAAILESSTGYLRHIAHGRKVIRLGFADALLKLMHVYGAKNLTLKDLPLSEDAKLQHDIRTRSV